MFFKKKKKGCHLLQKSDLTPDDLRPKTAFRTIETLRNDVHDSRHILACQDCGRIYLHDFHEDIDMVSGNDPQYHLWIPLESEKIAKEHGTKSRLELLGMTPRIESNWPADAEAPVITIVT